MNVTMSAKQAIIHYSCEKCLDTTNTGECGHECHLDRTQSVICPDCKTSNYFPAYVSAQEAGYCHACNYPIKTR